ncbi:MAG: hypothetical protein ABEJ43_05530 [Haloferacaceae archaeon]
MFDGDRYEVQQKALSIGNTYTISEGPEGAVEPILQAKQKLLQMKEDFRFTAPDGEELRFRVTTDQVLDLKGSYQVVDERTDEVVGAIERESLGFFRQEWGLVGPDGERAATVSEDSLAKALLRRHVTGLLPVAFEVRGPDGGVRANIDGSFSLRDHYTIQIHDDIDPRLVVIASAVIDAIEAN